MNDTSDDRSRAEQLIAIADKLSQQKLPDRRNRRWVPILVAVLGVGALTGGVVGLLSMDDDRGSSGNASPAATDPLTTSPTATQPQPESTAPLATQPETTEAPASAAPPTTAKSTSTTSASSTSSPATTTSVAGGASLAGPVRWAEFTGGKVYLQGRVPDQATSDEVRDKAAGVVGPANVVVQYVIDPDAPRPNSAPLYVRDSVLFPPNSTAIDDTARGVLDLGVALMTQNPAVTIDINGYTDSDGNEDANLALSQVRVDQIFAYMVSKGIDPAKLTKTAHGEADPVADNATAEGRAKNRRVEFTVNNLLG